MISVLISFIGYYYFIYEGESGIFFSTEEKREDTEGTKLDVGQLRCGFFEPSKTS